MFVLYFCVLIMIRFGRVFWWELESVCELIFDVVWVSGFMGEEVFIGVFLG